MINGGSAAVALDSLLHHRHDFYRNSLSPVLLNRNQTPNRNIGDDEEDEFYDPLESISVASSSDEDDKGSSSFKSSLTRRFVKQNSSVSSQSCYYDADDDFCSDGSISKSSSSLNIDIEKELAALRLCYSEEAEKREKAENISHQLQLQWQKIAECLSHYEDVRFELDPNAICRDIIVTRIVSETFERELARAETEVIMAEIIESKNNEISRLRDRLQYYEAVNREMSQRNQEVVALSRQQRLRRNTKRKIIWSCVGLSITFGVSLLAYSKLSTSSSHASTPPTSISLEDGDCS